MRILFYLGFILTFLLSKFLLIANQTKTKKSYHVDNYSVSWDSSKFNYTLFWKWLLITIGLTSGLKVIQLLLLFVPSSSIEDLFVSFYMLVIQLLLLFVPSSSMLSHFLRDKSTYWKLSGEHYVDNMSGNLKQQIVKTIHIPTNVSTPCGGGGVGPAYVWVIGALPCEYERKFETANSQGHIRVPRP